MHASSISKPLVFSCHRDKQSSILAFCAFAGLLGYMVNFASTYHLFCVNAMAVLKMTRFFSSATSFSFTVARLLGREAFNESAIMLAFALYS